MESFSWVYGLGVALALMLAPAGRALWKRFADYDERRVAEIGRRLKDAGDRTTSFGTVPLFR